MSNGLIFRTQVLAPLMQLELWGKDYSEIEQILRTDYPDITEYRIFLYGEVPETLDLIDWKSILSECGNDEDKAKSIAWWLYNKGYI